ncbi:hypothetical protein, partial [Nocardia veterana]
TMTNAAAADRIIEIIDDALADDSWEHGPDAMRWSPVEQQPAPLCVGAVVDYHGSLTSEYGEYVVVGIDSINGRLTLRHYDYPEIRLDRVRRTSVTDTGERAPVCQECGHPATHRYRAHPGACPRVGCECPNHA